MNEYKIIEQSSCLEKGEVILQRKGGTGIVLRFKEMANTILLWISDEEYKARRWKQVYYPRGMKEACEDKFYFGSNKVSWRKLQKIYKFLHETRVRLEDEKSDD